MDALFYIAVLINILLAAVIISILISKNKKLCDNKEALNNLQSALFGLLSDTKKQAAQNAYLQRREVREMFGAIGDNFSNTLNKTAVSNAASMECLRKTVETQLKNMSDSNERRLEQMRATVDQQLSETLNQRLTGSFKQVSDQLEQVFVSMGEVRSLAAGVGDLKRVLSNVKVRGTWGEAQLGSLLSAMLSPAQYVKDAVIGKGREHVEYAVLLPGLNKEPRLLPIDSKFPMEDYIRKDNMLASGDTQLAKEALKALGKSLITEAKRIRDKYIYPPDTTDFAIMYLPTEGLYADAINIGIFDICQREYNITIAGPSTLTALLSSLQMGFRTLAIEKRSGEVLKLLDITRNAFSGFISAIEKTQRSLSAAQNNLEEASRKSRRLEKQLSDVQMLDSAHSE